VGGLGLINLLSKPAATGEGIKAWHPLRMNNEAVNETGTKKRPITDEKKLFRFMISSFG
jgi:hypothetical protein